MKFISAGPDYEGLSGGYYLYGETESIYLDLPESLGTNDVELNQIITVKGKVGYCGGKKIAKYICGLSEVELVEVSEEISCAKKGEFVNPDDLKGKTRYPDFCCAGLKGLMAYVINDKGECVHLKGTPYLTCIPCGNGMCETAENGFNENKCNCPEDCL